MPTSSILVGDPTGDLSLLDYLLNHARDAAFRVVASCVRHHLPSFVALLTPEERETLCDSLLQQLDAPELRRVIRAMHPRSTLEIAVQTDPMGTVDHHGEPPSTVAEVTEIRPLSPTETPSDPGFELSTVERVTSIGLSSRKRCHQQFRKVKKKLIQRMTQKATQGPLYPKICSDADCSLCLSWYLSSYLTPCSSKYGCTSPCFELGYGPHSTKRGFDNLRKYHQHVRSVPIRVNTYIPKPSEVEFELSILQQEEWSIYMDKQSTEIRNKFARVTLLLQGLVPGGDDPESSDDQSSRIESQEDARVKSTGCLRSKRTTPEYRALNRTINHTSTRSGSSNTASPRKRKA